MPDPVVIPTTAAALQEAVREALELRVPGVAHECFPDKPEGYRLTHQVGACLVAYRGADYGPAAATDGSHYERTPLVDVHCKAYLLSGVDGAVALLDRARVALTGLALPGFGRLAPRAERFVSHEEGVWTYALTVAARTLAVASAPDSTGPTIRSLVAESRDGRTVLVSST